MLFRSVSSRCLQSQRSKRTRNLSYISPYAPGFTHFEESKDRSLPWSPINPEDSPDNRSFGARLRSLVPSPKTPLSPRQLFPPLPQPDFEKWLNEGVSLSTHHTHRGLDQSLDLSSSLARSTDDRGSRIYLDEDLSQSLEDLSRSTHARKSNAGRRKKILRTYPSLYPTAETLYFRFPDSPSKGAIEKLGKKVAKGTVINPLSWLASGKSYNEYERQLAFEPRAKVIGASVYKRFIENPEELGIFRKASKGKGKKKEPKKHA